MKILPVLPHKADPEFRPLGGTAPKILVAEAAYRDMHFIIEASPQNEIGWLGSVQETPDGYLIDRVFLFKQEVSTTHCEFDTSALGELVAEKIKNPADREVIRRLRFWGHLHPDNMTDPSNQDEKQMDLFKHNPYFIRGIFTRMGICKYCFFDYARGIRVDDCPWNLQILTDETRRAAIAVEVEEKVSVSNPWRGRWFETKRESYSDDDYSSWPYPLGGAVGDPIAERDVFEPGKDYLEDDEGDLVRRTKASKRKR